MYIRQEWQLRAMARWKGTSRWRNLRGLREELVSTPHGFYRRFVPKVREVKENARTTPVKGFLRVVVKHSGVYNRGDEYTHLYHALAARPEIGSRLCKTLADRRRRAKNRAIKEAAAEARGSDTEDSE